MKKYVVCLCLMFKRMLKKPAFLLMLLCLPILAVVVDRMEHMGNTKGAAVGVLFAEERMAVSSEEYSEWNQRLILLLQEQEGILDFYVYNSQELLFEEVERGVLNCALVFPTDLQEKLKDNTWQAEIALYETSSSMLTEIVKEKTAGAVFALYSEEAYLNYVETAEAFEAAEENGNTREEIVRFAENAYETHLLDGSTFAFRYHGRTLGEVQQTATVNFRLRGVLSVCIFISGLCGLLVDWEDRQRRQFVRIMPSWMTTIVNIWIPTVYTSVVAMLALYLTGQFTGILAELSRICFFQLLIVGYCSILKLIIRKKESIAASVPILSLAGMVCCPVWIRLALYLPVFSVLEKLFPMTYYLLW
ncbi:MAG: hypothetical protein J1F41_07355 [Lachnospiraceae bacterium]|nr:hypothetical protein [Lachnospiraceae bacterium]